MRNRMMSHSTGFSLNPLPRLALPAVAALLAVHTPALAQKTDVVTLNNGDDVTGEVKEIEPSHKHIRLLIDEAPVDWKDLEGKDVVLLSGTNVKILSVVRSLAVGKTVECQFVERGGRYAPCLFLLTNSSFLRLYEV